MNAISPRNSAEGVSQPHPSPAAPRGELQACERLDGGRVGTRRTHVAESDAHVPTLQQGADSAEQLGQL